MNQPDRIKSWVLDVENGEKVMEITDDPRLPHAITVIFRKQDHTLGGMLRSQLLLNPSVLFAGYRVPHPLETNIELRLQTDSTTTPRAALQRACSDLILLTRKLKSQFAEQARTAEIAGGGVGDAYGGGAGRVGQGQGQAQVQGTRATVEDVYGGIPVGGEMLASQVPEDPYAF